MDELCLDFVNTVREARHRRGRTRSDPLSDSRSTAEFFRSHGVTVAGPADPKVLHTLRQMREFLTSVLETLTGGGALPESAMARVNSYFSLAPCLYHAEKSENGYEIKVVPLFSDWNWALCMIAASFTRLAAPERVPLLRKCENPDCARFFWDETKSHTKRCCCDGCANLMKIRRYRAKKHGAAVE